MGRPSKRTEAVIARVLKGLSEGTPLTVICRADDMPHDNKIREWANGDAELAGAIARARLDGFDVIAEECLAIADDGTNDYVEKERPDGSKYEAFDSEHVQRSRLRVDTRLKLLAKWDPKRYGERQLIGSDPDNPLPQSFQVNLVKAPGDQ